MEDRHLAVMIAQRCRQYGDRVAMRYKSGETWQEITYRELGQQIQRVAAALVKMGVQAGDRVGIFSHNRAEWAIADFAILSVDAVTVPIYATNTSSQTEYIVRDAGLKVIFVGDEEQNDKVRAFADQDDLLHHIILFDSPASSSRDGGRTSTFASLLEQAPPTGDPAPMAEKRPSDTSRHLASIIYTSGTTGDPKGVMLSHGNFFHQIDAVNANFQVGPEDRSCAFCPLVMSMSASGHISFSTRGPRTIIYGIPGRFFNISAKSNPRRWSACHGCMKKSMRPSWTASTRRPRSANAFSHGPLGLDVNGRTLAATTGGRAWG